MLSKREPCFWKEYVIVTLGYILVTSIILYPIPFQITKSFSLQGGDYAQFIWNLWWVKKAVTELHTNPYFTSYLFHPNGVSLIFHVLTPYNSFLSIPLQYFVNIITAFNILLLSNFVISGLTTYLLVKYLTGSRAAAFIAGLYYSFNPYHSLNLFQLNQASIQWIPLACLYLIKISREVKIRHTVLGAVFISLTALASWYQLIFLFLFTILFIIYHILFQREKVLNQRFLFHITLMGILTIGFLSPILFPMIREALTGSPSLKLISPSRHLDLLGVKRGVFIFFWPVFFGYIILLVTFISIKAYQDIEKAFWIVSFIFFLIISLGPQLHILGESYPRVPMLKSFLEKIPFIQGTRVSTRFLLMSFLSFAVMTGYSCNYIRNHLFYHKPITGSVVISLIGLAIILEFLSPPRPSVEVRIPKIYYEMAEDTEDYAVIELPILFLKKMETNTKDPELALSFQQRNCYGTYMFYQTIHEKKLLWGYISRKIPQSSYKFLVENEVLDFFWKEDTEKIRSSDKLIDLLSRNDFRYIIIHKRTTIPYSPYKQQRANHKKHVSIRDRIATALLPFSLNKMINQSKFAGGFSIIEHDVEETSEILDEIFGESIINDSDMVVYRIEQ